MVPFFIDLGATRRPADAAPWNLSRSGSYLHCPSG
jgi:hypothetical protein